MRVDSEDPESSGIGTSNRESDGDWINSLYNIYVDIR